MLFVLEVMFNDSKDVDRRIVDSIKNGRNNAVFWLMIHFCCYFLKEETPCRKVTLSYRLLSIVRERKQEEMKERDASEILVQTCIDPVAVKTYEDMKTIITEKFPDHKFSFKHELYPIPLWKEVWLELTW